ncbi:MAG TPA: hypothetical protein ENH85_10405 [Candidatus Scalindua sp.]|nr:hypothetical protein [Candidatus Scalindua sp.]
MELPSNNPDSKLSQSATAFSEIVRVGLKFLGWSVVAFVAGCAGFLVMRVAYKFLVAILTAIGEI